MNDAILKNWLVLLRERVRKDKYYLLIGAIVLVVLVIANLSLRFNQNAPWFDRFSVAVNQTLYGKDRITDAQKALLTKDARGKYTGEELTKALDEIGALTKLEATKKIDRLLSPEKFTGRYSLWRDIQSKNITNTWIYVFFILVVVVLSWQLGGQRLLILTATTFGATYLFYDLMSLFAFSFFVQALSVTLFSTILFLLPISSSADKKEALLTKRLVETESEKARERGAKEEQEKIVRNVIHEVKKYHDKHEKLTKDFDALKTRFDAETLRVAVELEVANRGQIENLEKENQVLRSQLSDLKKNCNKDVFAIIKASFPSLTFHRNAEDDFLRIDRSAAANLIDVFRLLSEQRERRGNDDCKVDSDPEKNFPGHKRVEHCSVNLGKGKDKGRVHWSSDNATKMVLKIDDAHQTHQV